MHDAYQHLHGSLGRRPGLGMQRLCMSAMTWGSRQATGMGSMPRAAAAGEYLTLDISGGEHGGLVLSGKLVGRHGVRVM